MRSATALKHRVRPDSERTRRRLSAAGKVRERNCSVARTLGILLDAGVFLIIREAKWTFVVIREAFLGVRRFDKFLSELMIALNILADRLNRLIDRGIFKRRKYQDHKPVAACNMRCRLNYDAWDYEADSSDGRAAPGRI